MVKLEMLEGHVATCEFSVVQCSNDGCEVIIDRRDQLNHEMNDCNSPYTQPRTGGSAEKSLGMTLPYTR